MRRMTPHRGDACFLFSVRPIAARLTKVAEAIPSSFCYCEHLKGARQSPTPQPHLDCFVAVAPRKDKGGDASQRQGGGTLQRQRVVPCKDSLLVGDKHPPYTIVIASRALSVMSARRGNLSVCLALQTLHCPGNQER